MNTDAKRRQIEEALRRLAGRTPEAAPVPKSPVASPEAIAIVGCAGSLPGASSLHEFWTALDGNTSLITEIPPERTELRAALGTPDRPGTIASKWGGFLRDIAGFDPEFFQIAPADAGRMDPRQRLLLMAAHHAIEDAGHAPSALRGSRTGVFVAGEENQYAQTLIEQGIEPGEAHAGSMLANRISYCFDLRGPSEVVDTMCSGAAVALHRAIQALRSGEIEQALVGAVNLLLRPELLVELSRTGQLTPGPLVHSFGADADGSLRSEGVGCVLLKPLAQALADGDAIHALIRHSAVNYNGRGGLSMSAPQTAVHSELIQRAWREAGIAASRLTYVEAQGMGTMVADVAEWEAISRATMALARDEGLTLPAGACRVSTVKPMAGHMNSASALGALFKVIHSLQTSIVYPIQGFTRLNPTLESDGQVCRPVSVGDAWPTQAQPRVAGIHAYGAGGNNAHLVIEEAPVPALAGGATPSGPTVIPLSARSEAQLRKVAESLVETLRAQPTIRLVDLAFTLQHGRSGMEERAAFVVSDLKELQEGLIGYLAGRTGELCYRGSVSWKRLAEAGGTSARPRDAIELARFWAKGDPVTWPSRAQTGARRLHLPGYPFATAAYWWTKATPAPIAAIAQEEREELEPRIEGILQSQMAACLQLPLDRLDPERPLVDLGFTSLKLVDYAARLSTCFGFELSPAVFFGRSTLRELAHHLATSQTAAMQSCLGSGRAEPAVAPFAEEKPTPTADLTDDAVAIIGMSGRFAGARTVADLWSLIEAGRSAVTEIPAERFDWRRVYSPNPTATQTSGKWCGSLPGVAEFDPLFFEISPLEAETMDPRQRLLLQEAWNALEEAAIGARALETQCVAIFVGAEEGDYHSRVGQRTLTSSHDGMLAARLAYFLNLKGPAMTLNTACSSSLVAVHQACQSLRSGESDVALAAGVNLMLSAAPYIGMSQAGMLSPDGVCSAFDARANGLVPGEAVCAVVLKRLAQALKDGDPIRAVIRGSGVNYDGRTNGITAPNGVAQTELIRGIHQRFGIPAEQIGLVVAHGTGTKLGDPVEVNALVEAFQASTAKEGFCALTSTKPNVGHAFAASGLVSLVTLVESVQRGVIPASIHFGERNPFIHWERSPFYVSAQTQAWPRALAVRRVGAVSAFGMSGTNAHVIVEASGETVDQPRTPPPAFLLVCSAKSAEALDLKLAALHGFLAGSAAPLDAVAHTLLEGRHHFRYRFAVLVGSREEALRALTDRPPAPDRVVEAFRPERGKLAEIDRLLARSPKLLADPAAYRAVLSELGTLYREGYVPNSARLFAGEPPRRLALPTYPFARKQCWVEAPGERPTAKPHPLIATASADGAGTRFDSLLTGTEYFLADHVVLGERMLPGVAYLEMARAAFTQGAPLGPVRVSQVAWARPFTVGEKAATLSLRLAPAVDGSAPYEVFSIGPDGSRILHSQGRVGAAIGAASGDVGLAQLQARFTGRTVAAESCRAAFRAMGLAYGPTFEALQEVRVGREEILAKLSLPAGTTSVPTGLYLHPGLLDSALQASVGFILGTESPLLGKASAPFSLESIEIFGPTEPTMWAWLRRSPGSENDSVQKLDLDIYGSSGEPVIRLCRFATRVIERPRPVEASQTPAAALTLLRPVWSSFRLAPAAVPTPSAQATVLVIGGDEVSRQAIGHLCPQAQTDAWPMPASAEEIAAWLGDRPAFEHIFWIAPDDSSAGPLDERMVEGQEAGVLAFFRTIKGLLAAGYGAGRLGLTVATFNSVAVHDGEAASPAHASIHGLVGSLAKEYPLWAVRLLDLPSPSAWPVRDSLLVPAEAGGDVVAWRHGEWFRLDLAPLRGEAEGPEVYREGGTYVVIGGAGGLGEVWSRHVISRFQAQVFWIGRRPASPQIAEQLADLGRVGPAPIYLQADAGDWASLEGALAQIKQRTGKIHGVVHSAIVLADRGLANLTEAEFRSALAAKVDVSVRLAQVFAPEGLDFMLFFSSLTAFEKGPGQANYAAGCTFKDAFARALGRGAGCAVKVMNWSYWGSVGVVRDAAIRERMERSGVGSIEPAEGMAALSTLLRGPLEQLVFLKTIGPRVLEQVGSTEWTAVYPVAQPVLLPAEEAVRLRARAGLAGLPDPRLVQGEPMDPLLLRLLLGTLQQSGLAAGGRERLRQPLDRWYDESLRLLTERGLPLGTAPTVDLIQAWAEWDRAKLAWMADDSQAAMVRLLETCVRGLPAVLQGTALATDLLFPNSSMERVEKIYKGNPVADYFNAVLADGIVGAIEARLARDPSARLRILEIGAGTGGTTSLLLPRLERFAGAIAEYRYTDISKAFLLHAQSAYAPGRPFLVTDLFDVERPLTGQPVPADGFDFVLATNCLHATRNIRQTLRNAKAALHRHGLLFLNEMRLNPLSLQLTFGLLEGWWRFEDDALRMPGSPGIEPSTWARLLREEGFGPIQFPAEEAKAWGQQIIVAGSDGVIRQSLATAAAPVALPARTNPVPVARPSGRAGVTDSRIRLLVRDCIGWALRLEAPEIQDDRSFAEYGVDSIIGVQVVNHINEAFGLALPTTVLFDYNTVDRLVGHLIEQHGAVLDRLSAPAPETTPAPAVSAVAVDRSRLHQRARLLRPGTIDEIVLEEVPAPIPGPGEVLVEVRAFSLNFSDLLCVKGLYPNMPPYPFTPGVEASGVIVATGPGVTDERVGDEVVALAAGCHAGLLCCPVESVFAKPAGRSFEEACALPAVAIAMVDAFRKAALLPGETILIQTAAGGTGLIAVQLAQHAQAHVIATAGSARKLEYLRGQGVTELINYRESDFEAEVRRMTQGRGVDVVINTLPGEALAKGLRCLAPGGRYIEIAMTSLKSAKAVDLSVLSDNQTFFSIDVGKLHLTQPGRMRALRAEMLRLWAEGVIRPTVNRVFAFGDLREAYRALENRANIGKLVVRVDLAASAPALQAIDRVAGEVPAPASASDGLPETIAIVGMSGRFAKSETLEAYWAHLARGDNLVEKATRWDLGYLAPDACRHGSFVESIDRFDPLFFNISGTEATHMDPQQRVFLEEAWKALEDAGYAGESLKGRRCGVYVGCDRGNYPDLFTEVPPPQAFWGNTGAVIPARISYFLDLQGPAIAVDTACSSSLVAIHLACEGLRSGDTDVALAGGVFLQATSGFYYAANQAGMLSPSGACHTFDGRADGFVPGEGAGAIVLKRLRDAQAAGDQILGLIRGSGINQDGYTNGITAPSALSQERLERQVYDTFRINPEHIQLVEAHGTGTRLGDPIEFAALTRAFRGYTQKSGYCALGSVKTNIGHAATAAGIAGVLKVLLALRHRQIPPSLNFASANPGIALDSSPFFVNTALRDWDCPPGATRNAAISSFGFSGTNAHVVITEAPVSVDRPSAPRPRLVVLSAQSPGQLIEQAEQLLTAVAQPAAPSLAAVAYTLMVGRRHLPYRLALVCSSSEELIARLRRARTGEPSEGIFRSGGSMAVAQSQATEQDLIGLARQPSAEPQARAALERVAQAFVQASRLAYVDLFEPGLRRVSLPTYPFARERYWVKQTDAPGLERRAGVSRPLHPLVHANVSGVNGLRFTSRYTGGEFFFDHHRIAGQRILPGVAGLEMARAALVIGSEADPHAAVVIENWIWTQPVAFQADPLTVEIELRPDAGRGLAVTINSVTGSGERLVCARGFGRILLEAASTACDLEQIRARTREVIATPPETYERFAQLGQQYGAGLRSLVSVRFGEGEIFAELALPDSLAASAGDFGLHPSLADGALQATLAVALQLGEGAEADRAPYLPYAIERVELRRALPARVFAWIRSSGPTAPDSAVRKVDIDLCDPTGRTLATLVGLSSRRGIVARTEPSLHPLIHTAVGAGRYISQFSGREYFLAEHVVGGWPTLPAVAYLEMARAVAALSGGPVEPVSLTEAVWSQPLQVRRAGLEIVTELLETAGARQVRVVSGDTQRPIVHFQCTLARGNTPPPAPVAMALVEARCPQTVDPAQVADLFGAQGFSAFAPGARLNTLTGFSYSSVEAVACLERRGPADGVLDLALLDGALTAIHLHHGLMSGRREAALPFALREFTLVAALPDQMRVHLERLPGAESQYHAALCAEDGSVCAILRGYVLKAAGRRSPASLLYAVPGWESAPLRPSVGGKLPGVPTFVLAQAETGLESALRTRWPNARIELLAAEAEMAMLGLFGILKARLEAKAEEVGPVVVLAPAQGLGAAGLAALVRTACLESNRLAATVVEYAPGQPHSLVTRLADELAAGALPLELRLGAGTDRSVRRLTEVALSDSVGEGPALAAGDVVLITGGLGGLGRIFARHFATAPGVTVVLTGRSEATLPVELTQMPGRIVYCRCDTSAGTALAELVERIETELGRLRGVVHSAGVTRDAYFIKKTEAELTQVFAAKVRGTLALDHALRGCDLAFFVMFSTLGAVTGAPGQADYAAANAFMDAFAAERTRLATRGERRGVTRSINWPAWQEGGMKLDGDTARRLAEATGIGPLDTAAGLAAFDAVLCSPHPQVIVAPGDAAQIRSRLLRRSEPERAGAPADGPVAATGPLARELAGLVSELQGIAREKIDATSELSVYGFDSISFTEFASRLSAAYGIAVMPTVFFEHPTLSSLAQHLCGKYPDQMSARFGAPTPAPRPWVVPAPVVAPLPAARATGPEPIAVIGMSGRFPGSADLAAFWRHLEANDDLISEVPADRWDWRGIYGDPHAEPGKTRVKWGGFIEGVDDFDFGFFGISRREAESMDPQQRLLMQYVWLAIEDAGYAPERLAGSDTGLFIATGNSGRGLAGKDGAGPLDIYSTTGVVPSVGPNRMSYFLDLHGPSEPIETACSSGLVAIHRAIACLRNGDCTQAIVGGLNTMVVPEGHISLDQAGMLTPDGRCKTFSAEADGYARGEGVGMLFLKPLSAAERDGDAIYGLILGSAENHGGRANSLTAPNPKAQAALLRRAYTGAGVDPRSVSYIEAHGTGTELGDPVEVGALQAAFAELSDQFPAVGPASGLATCGLGSVKTNIGHLELAAGIAGVVKVLLQMRHRTLVKTLHCEQPNPYLQLDGSPFYLVRENRPWATPLDAQGRPTPRRAGVSSFGFGGVNAHVILEEYTAPATDRPTATEPAQLLALSAKTPERLAQVAADLLCWIERTAPEDGGDRVADLALTLQVGRSGLEERAAFLASTVAAVREALRALAGGADHTELFRGNARKHPETVALFAEDAEMREALHKWTERAKLDRLAEAWVQGVTVDWTQLARPAGARRLRLPGYPFAAESCRPVARVARSKRFLTQTWVETPAVPPQPFAGVVAILTNAASRNTARAIQQRLPSAVLVEAADGATDAPSVGTFVACVDVVGTVPGEAMDLSGVDWLRRLIDGAERKGLRLLGVTRGLDAAIPRESSVSAAPRAALYRMLQAEYGAISSRQVDVAVECSDDALADVVVAELGILTGPSQVRYGAAGRETPRLAEVASTIGSDERAPDLSGGVVWVTGGTRGLGALCARHLVAAYGVRTLVLSGREALPPRELWPQAATSPAMAQKIAAIEALEAKGVTVRVVATALESGEAVRSEVAAIVRELGPIVGLLYCAGVLDRENPAFIRKSAESMRDVLAPKVSGLDHLLAALQGQPLELCLLFSSVAAAVPGLAAGGSDYAMGNAYLDAVARSRAGLLPVVSVQWPAWAESGMGGAPGARYLQAGFTAHTDREGLALLDEVLSRRLGPVVLPAMVEGALWRPESLFELQPVAPAERAIITPRLAAVTASPVADDAALAWLSEIFATELRMPIEQLDPQIPFAQIGADSILLAQVTRRLSGRLGETVDPSLLYEFPTLQALAREIDRRVASREPRVEARPVVAAIPAQAKPPSAEPIGTEIAVIGMACRFPGAVNLEEYWRLLAQGRSAIAPVPVSRKGGRGHAYAALIDPIDAFDPSFFLIPLEDARAMDPQAILVLEESLGLFSDAGYALPDLKGRAIGVYLGARCQHQPSAEDLRQARNPILAVGNNYLAANLSHFYDLRGPSLVVDTACSSALVGMHMAIQALQAGQIESAVVGGVSLLTGERGLQTFEQRKLLSAEPEFHLFDRRASGIILGEGCGLVLLKPLKQAQRDGDRVHAVIRGLAINNDGRTAGPATPNLEAQKAVMRDALARSGCAPAAIGYVEVNGSGSEVTDLLELKAIQAVYRTGATGECQLGSIKPNIGHPLCAEGIAGFIKLALMVGRAQRVPFLSGLEPMTHFNLEQSPFRFCRQAQSWGGPEVLGALNCFADGGTNAHVIVSAPPAADVSVLPRAARPVPALTRVPLRAPSGVRTWDTATSVQTVVELQDSAPTAPAAATGLSGAPSRWKRNRTPSS